MNAIRGVSAVVSILATIAMLSACGGDGSSSPPPDPVDTTEPTVSNVQAPARINRTVTLSATASDNVGVTEVRFFVDDEMLGSVASPPYSIEWDTSDEIEGEHVLTAEAEDEAGNVGRSGETSVTVRNMQEFTVELSGEEEVPPVDAQATAVAVLDVHLVTGEMSGDVTVTGLMSTAAHIHDAFAGNNGGIVVPLDQDPNDPALFNVPQGTTLGDADIERLLAGALYVNVHSDAQPAGAIRGQILPEGFVLRFTELSGRQEVPVVETAARGRAAITIDQESGALVVHARVDNLDDAEQAHVHDGYAGADGPVLVPLSQDAMDAGHWLVEDGDLGAAGLDGYAAGRMYVNVHTPEHPGGEVRGQVVPDGITLLFTELTGLQEVPAVDTKADGLAALTLDEADQLLTIHANTRRLNDASDAHLHGAYAGVDGPVVIGLTQDGSEPSHWLAEEQPLTAAELTALQDGATYVNVHSPAHPGGEIRGQVIPDHVVFAFGRLEGRQQVPPVDTVADGTFAVTVDPEAGTLVAHANTSGVDDSVAAHLHEGFAGTNGPVAIGLERDPMEDARWSAVDAPVDADQLADLLAGGWYVNVHTPANPDGEIRGQVAPPPVEVLVTDLSGDQEVPAVASAATGIAASTVNRDSGALTLHVNAEGADDATASHIHGGFAGQNGGVLIGLTQDPMDPGHWFAIDAELDDAGLGDYIDGRLYVNLHTPANPGGEIRGQLVPQGIQVLMTALDGDQVVPPVATGANGVAATTADLASRQLAVFVNASGADDAISAGIHSAPADENGPEVLPLEQTPMEPGQWSAIGGLDAPSFAAYRAGRLYVQVATPAEPDGEIRGQIVPPDPIEVDSEAPSVTLTPPGATVNGTVTLEADASDDIGVVEVRFLVDGVVIGSDAAAPYSIDWDTTTVTDGDKTLTAEAEDDAGNIATSTGVDVTVQNAAMVTLTQIQNEVFTPICSGCHTGPTSNALPSGMNLSSTQDSFSALVGVASIQVPAVDRVEPGDPDNSYLIHKLEGTQSVGARMPQGGPFLDQETIETVRQWINDGAPNN